MADDVTVDNGTLTDYAVATDDDGTGKHVQVVKLAQSADGSRTPILADGNGLEVQAGAAFPVTDNGGSLTVDNGGTFAVQADTELTTADLDTGAGTDTRAVVGIAGAASGGAALIEGTAANGLEVDVTRVAGTVTVDGSAVTQPVSHAALTELAAAIDTELQVDIVGALPAGTANIGDVDVASIAAGDNNIGNVDLASAIPAGTNNIGDVDVVGGTTAHDGAGGSVNPLPIGGYASDAIPTEVSADTDIVRAWLLRNGAFMTALAPHLGMIADPYTLSSKTVQVTTTQTGSDVVTPTAGKRLVVTQVQIQAGGTTAATVQLWFGANADTTYSRGTDLAIFDGEFAPSSTLKPGFAQTGLWIASAADHEIHLTTSAGITLTVTVWYYEV